MGLDQGHLWFVGADEDYWDSDVKYPCPQALEDSQGGPAMGFGEETYDAGETRVIDDEPSDGGPEVVDEKGKYRAVRFR